MNDYHGSSWSGHRCPINLNKVIRTGVILIKLLSHNYLVHEDVVSLVE